MQSTIRPIFSTHLRPKFLNTHAKDKAHGSHYPQGAHGRFTMIAPLHAIQKGPLFWHYALLRKQLPSFTIRCIFVYYSNACVDFFENGLFTSLEIRTMSEMITRNSCSILYGLLVWFIGRSFMCTNCCLCKWLFFMYGRICYFCILWRIVSSIEIRSWN